MEAAVTRRPPARARCLRAVRSAVAVPGLAACHFAAALLLVPAAPASAGELPSKPAELLGKLRARVQAVDARLDGVLAETQDRLHSPAN